MTPKNAALWLPRPTGRLSTGPAPYTHPGPGEVVVRVRAVAVNPVDGIPGALRRVFLPWLRYPAVLGGDVAGEVVELGAGVTRVRRGDRVAGMAVGTERSRNRAAEGAFQLYVVLLEQLVTTIPESLSFEQAAVLPLTLSTAATALFQRDHLALSLPRAHAPARPETVLVWGGSTGVGSNAIQLARNAGYRVVATASAHNFDYIKALGADAVVDRRAPDAAAQLVDAIGGTPVAGGFAIGKGSLRPVVEVIRRGGSAGRVASAQPGLATRLQALTIPHRGIRVGGVWGGTLKDNEVGPAVYNDFLPSALADGRYRAAPPATVVGEGLDAITVALQRLREGISAGKYVVSL
jgi:NADPH:quinone reductase-like Zn-dependent oxidoreductase